MGRIPKALKIFLFAVGGLVGLWWRPIPSVVLRADYFFTNRTLNHFEPGFRSAVSIMF